MTGVTGVIEVIRDLILIPKQNSIFQDMFFYMSGVTGVMEVIRKLIKILKLN